MITKVFLGLFLVSISVSAANICRTDYFSNRDNIEREEKVQDAIERLPQLILDVANPKESLRRLIEEIRGLHPEFSELAVLEHLWKNGQVSSQILQVVVSQYREKILAKTEGLLQSLGGELPTSQQRKVLEGYRILFNRLRDIEQRAQEEINEQNRQEEELQKEKDEEKDTQEKLSSEEEQNEESSNPESKKENSDQKDNKEQKNQRQQQKDKKSKNQQKQNEQNESQNEKNEEQDSQESEDKNLDPKELEKLVENLKEEIQKQAKEQDQKQQKKQKEKQQQQKKDKQNNKKDSQDQNQKDSSEENQKGEKQEGDEQEGQGQQSEQQGEGQKESQGQGEGQSQEAQPGEKGQKGEGKPQPGQGKESSESNSQSSEESSDGSSQSRQIESGVAEKLSEYLKNLLAPKGSQSKESKEKNSQAGDELQSEHSEGQESKQSKQAQVEREERMRRYKEERERQLERDEQAKQQQADSNKNRRSGGMSDALAKLSEMDKLQQSEFIKNYMDQLWAETLRNYTNHNKLMTSLSHFRSIADSFAGKFSEFSFLKQYSKRAHNVYEELDSAQISYKDLNHFALSFVGDGAGGNVYRKLRFLITVLENLKQVSSLSLEEESILNRAYELFAERRLGAQDYEKQLGKAFVSQMVGPLSRMDLKKHYPSQDPKEDYDWKALAQAIKSGKLNDFVAFSRVKSYLNMFHRRTFKPRNQKVFSGQKVPINESEPQLDLADDLDRAPYFHRDGSNPREDLLRLISGDMLENIYPDQKLRQNPKDKIPKIVTIVVFDVSGSMNADKGQKDKIRNALIASYLDKTQIDTVTGRADHVYYFIPFDGAPHAAERVGDFAGAKEYFNRFRSYPQSSGGSTEITDTLVSVYESIAKHQKEGGELDYANILFITDGEAPLHMSKIEAARNKVNPEVDIILNAITLGGKNEVVDKLIKENGGTDGKLGKVYHQHMEMEQMNGLLNHKERLDQIEKVAEDFNSETDVNFNRDLLFKIKNELAKLAGQREYRDRGDATSGLRLIRDLESINSPGVKALNFPLAIFLSTIEGVVSEGWSLGRRSEALQKYLEGITQIYKINVSDLLKGIDPATRQKLIVWLKKN